ncbi:MAG: bifunctional diguanylate cyclase/phosphodiesterase [Methyloceanibacter sp.]|nr:bifunctional diguanylate cyclase/phosphodiesterase [Methyloceanibacter sp.]
MGLTLFAMLIALAALIAPNRISLLELEREAFAAENQIREKLLEDPQLVTHALTVPGGATQLTELFNDAGFGQRLLRYELYDSKGDLVFTRGLANLRLNRPAIAASINPNRNGATIGLYAGDGTNGPSHFARLHVPINLGSDVHGSLEIYLDQSKQAGVLTSYFGVIALVILALVGAGITIPLALAWTRGRAQRRAREEVLYLQSHDSLTGLANRAKFTERVGQALERIQDDDMHMAVITVNIDRFKELNETLEHQGGDRVLHDIGTRIQHVARDRDIVARLGGDEFAIALTDVAALSDVMAFVHRLGSALTRPFHVNNREVVLTTSLGIALAPADGDTADVLVRHSAIALSRAKLDGGQRMCFYEESMDKAVQQRHTIEQDLRHALRRGEFDVVYQPQYDLKTETPCGSEALIRWHHPQHGIVAPGHFISVAEETGLIVPIGEWVLRQACSDATQWPEHLTVAVNLSPAQFHDGDIAETVADILHETGLAANRLELEITESLLINDTEEVLAKLNRLRELGVRIAMDDFGTGYSSLSYLARFPFSKIKIDQQFVRNMTRDPAMRAIVKTIIALGESLRVTITAEGVETQEQADMLRRLGCPQVQGFLYGRPEKATVHADKTMSDAVSMSQLPKRPSAA